MTQKAPGGNSRMLWWTIAIVALARLLTLGLYPLTDTTEARYAEVARKMVELNDWITPWYDYGVPFWAKPPLSTWLTAASIKLFGVNEFAARLPYFLLALLIAWLVWDWARRRSPREAVLALGLLCGTMLYFIASAAVMTDLALVLGTTLAMRGFWALFDESGTTRPAEKWLLFFGLGIGMLAKGPVAVVLTGIPIVLWAVLTGNFVHTLKRMPWVRGSLLVIAIALPWYWIAEVRTPGFWEYFFIGEHWKRFTVTGWTGDKYGTAHATARGAIWLLAVAACLPWTALLPFMAIGRKSALARLSPPTAPMPGDLNSRRSWRIYLLAWAVSPCLFFTMSGNILWTYVLPALPALALLAGGWLAGDPRARRVDGVVSAGVLVMALLVAAFFGNQQLSDSWKTAKSAVGQYHVRNTQGLPLLFVGDLPYSASFYSQGKAKAVAGNAALEARLAKESAFVALNPDQVRELSAPLRARLRLEAQSGAYGLYFAAKAQ
jgi:4-amino-4-deoxy-L-arabinose transferase-like glycosyltransferase